MAERDTTAEIAIGSAEQEQVVEGQHFEQEYAVGQESVGVLLEIHPLQ